MSYMEVMGKIDLLKSIDIPQAASHIFDHFKELEEMKLSKDPTYKSSEVPCCI